MSRYANVRKILRRVADIVSSPYAAMIALAYVCFWAGSGFSSRFDTAWQLQIAIVSSVVTLLMVFILAFNQSADTAAINLKIDLLIASHPELTNVAVGLELKEDEHHEIVREEIAGMVQVRADADADDLASN